MFTAFFATWLLGTEGLRAGAPARARAPAPPAGPTFSLGGGTISTHSLAGGFLAPPRGLAAPARLAPPERGFGLGPAHFFSCSSRWPRSSSSLQTPHLTCADVGMGCLEGRGERQEVEWTGRQTSFKPFDRLAGAIFSHQQRTGTGTADGRSKGKSAAAALSRLRTVVVHLSPLNTS